MTYVDFILILQCGRHCHRYKQDHKISYLEEIKYIN